jgi:hypothetical protein
VDFTNFSREAGYGQDEIAVHRKYFSLRLREAHFSAATEEIFVGKGSVGRMSETGLLS